MIRLLEKLKENLQEYRVGNIVKQGKKSILKQNEDKKDYSIFMNEVKEKLPLLEKESLNGKTELEIKNIIAIEKCSQLYYFVQKFNKEQIVDVPLKFDVYNDPIYEHINITLRGCKVSFSWLDDTENKLNKKFEKYLKFRKDTLKALEFKTKIDLPIIVPGYDFENTRDHHPYESDKCKELREFTYIFLLENHTDYYFSTGEKWGRFGSNYCCPVLEKYKFLI